MNQGVAWGLLEKTPCRSISLPKVRRKELVFLRPDQLIALLNVADEPERTLYATLAWSGIRIGEALGLAWKHVDFDKGTLTIERQWNSYTHHLEPPKTDSSLRSVPMMPMLQKELREQHDFLHPELNDLLFTHGGEQPLDDSNLRDTLASDLKRAKLPRVTPHTFRHTFATTLLSSGASIKALQRSLGHGSVDMTLNVYAHLLGEDLGAALKRANDLYEQK